MHNFFARFKIRREYAGTTIPRLLETRWSGHLKAIECISNNFTELLDALKKIAAGQGTNLDTEDEALAKGIVSATTKKEFVFMLHFMREFLSVIEPANRILQDRDVGLRKALPIIETMMKNIRNLRTDEAHDRFLKLTEETVTANGLTQRSQKIRRRSYRLTDSVVMSTLRERRFDNDALLFESVHFEVIDRVICEMGDRFNNNNDILKKIRNKKSKNSIILMYSRVMKIKEFYEN